MNIQFSPPTGTHVSVETGRQDGVTESMDDRVVAKVGTIASFVLVSTAVSQFMASGAEVSW